MHSDRSIIFTGGLSLCSQRPPRRVERDFLSLGLGKLDQIIEQARLSGSPLVIAGPLVAKRFDVKVLAALLSRFENLNVTVLMDDSCRGADGMLDQHSTVGILHAAGRLNVIIENGYDENLSTESHPVFFMLPGEGLPQRLSENTLLVGRWSRPEDVPAIPGTSRVIMGGAISPLEVEDDVPVIAPGVVVRHRAEHEGVNPSIIRWWDRGDWARYPVEHLRSVFEHRALATEAPEISDSDFVTLLGKSSEGDPNEELLTIMKVVLKGSGNAGVAETVSRLYEETIE